MTKNFAQQGVVNLPENDTIPADWSLTFNSDKSNVDGKLTITANAQTHGRSVDALVFNPQFVQAGNSSR